MPATRTRRDGPARRSQTQRRASAETRLLSAAAQVIGEFGTSRMTLAQVGSTAGYSRGLAHHHFGSKAAVLDRLVEDVRADFSMAVAPALARSSPTERLIWLIRAFFELLDDLPATHRAYLAIWADSVATATDLRESTAAMDREFRRSISEAVNAGVGSGEMSASVDAASFAVALLGQLRGVALQRLIDPQGFNLADVATEIERTTLLAVGTTVQAIEDQPNSNGQDQDAT